MPNNLRPKLGFTEQRRPVPSKIIRSKDLRRTRVPVFRFHSVGTIVILFFSGTMTAVFFGFKTMIPIPDVILILLGMVFLSMAWQLLFTRSAFPMKRMENLAVAIFGLSPLLTGLFFMLNYAINLETALNGYRINKVYRGIHMVRFEVSGLPCEQYPELCQTDDEVLMKMEAGDTLMAKVGQGIFGYKVLKDLYLGKED